MNSKLEKLFDYRSTLQKSFRNSVYIKNQPEDEFKEELSSFSFFFFNQTKRDFSNSKEDYKQYI